MPQLGTFVKLPSEPIAVVQQSTSGDGLFRLAWSPPRGRSGCRDLTPATALWLARSVARLTIGFNWPRFSATHYGDFPLATSPHDGLRWDYIRRAGKPGYLRLGWPGGGCDLQAETASDGRLSVCGHGLERLIDEALGPLRAAAVDVREDAETWSVDRLLGEVTADGWPLALKLPTTPRAVSVSPVLAKCLACMSKPLGWEELGRLTRLTPPALQEFFTWESRYAVEPLSLGYVLFPVRLQNRDVITAYRMGFEVFGCDPLLSSLEPTPPMASDSAESPSALLPRDWYASAAARGLVSGFRPTRYGLMPVPRPEIRSAIGSTLAPDGLVSRRFPDRLRAMLQRTAAELVNWPGEPAGNAIAQIQRLGLLAWDVGNDADPVVRAARGQRDQFLDVGGEPDPIAAEGSDE